MNRKFAALLVGLLFLSPSVPARAFDLSGGNAATQDEFNSQANQVQQNRETIKRQQQEQAKRQWENRDKWKTMCYGLPSGDAVTACLGEYPHAVENERARNILLGNCYALGSGDLSTALGAICKEGASKCSWLSNGEAAYYCQKCGGRREWAALYAMGHLIQCF